MFNINELLDKYNKKNETSTANKTVISASSAAKPGFNALINKLKKNNAEAQKEETVAQEDDTPILSEEDTVIHVGSEDLNAVTKERMASVEEIVNTVENKDKPRVSPEEQKKNIADALAELGVEMETTSEEKTEDSVVDEVAVEESVAEESVVEEAPQAETVEVEETTETPAAEEAASVVEEQPKKRKRRTTKKETAASAAPVTTETEATQTKKEAADTFERANIIIDYVSGSAGDVDSYFSKFVSRYDGNEWYPLIKKFQERYNEIKVAGDMNASVLYYTLCDLQALQDEVSSYYIPSKAAIESFLDKDWGHCSILRIIGASGSNEAERKRNGYMSLMSVSTNDGTPPVNYLAIATAFKLRYTFLETLMNSIESKKRACITLLGAIKADAEATKMQV